MKPMFKIHPVLLAAALVLAAGPAFAAGSAVAEIHILKNQTLWFSCPELFTNSLWTSASLNSA